MRRESVRTIAEYLALVEEIGATHFCEENRLFTVRGGEILYRGQGSDYPLLPKIARRGSAESIVAREADMLSELRRLGSVHANLSDLDDWDLLTVAQHNGMATRLLDWTRNPLAAAWFASKDGISSNGVFVYVLLPGPEIHPLDRRAAPTPASHAGLSILRPKLEHPRIVAQDAWFTVHSESRKYRKFVPLGEREVNADAIIEIRLLADSREVLERLDTLGVSYRTAFPDLEGVCRYVNWKMGCAA